jgi:glycosyltransferase involved in cell wall biosynthesis
LQRPLKVLVFLHSFDPGGVERVALRLAKAWHDGGSSVRILVGRRTGAMSKQAPVLDYASYSSGPVCTARFETLWMILCLWRELRSGRADVVFCAGNTYTVVAAAIRLLLGRNCPPIVAKISNCLERPDLPAPARAGYRLWLKLQARLLDRWIAMSPPARAEAARMLEIDAGDIVVIDDPAIGEEDALRLASARDRATAEARQPGYFLAAGRLVRQKAFDRLIRAFAAGAGDADKLVILGDGPQRPRLQRLVERLRLQDRIWMPGHIEDLSMWFAGAQAFVLSSDYEGVPAVLIEALAAGVPIVATRCSASIDDLLGNGLFGQIIPRCDEAALATAIGTISTTHTNVGAGRRHAARFTVERAAPRYLKIMQDARSLGRPVIKPIFGAHHALAAAIRTADVQD